MATRKKPEQPKARHPLDDLEAGALDRVMMLMLWKRRHQEPDLYVKIDERDIAGFEDSVRYQKMKPAISVRRPRGLPAQDAIPAMGKRRAVPARAAIPDKPFVIVSLVEAGTQNTIRPVENNEQDFDTARESAELRKARDQAPDLAARLVRQANSGEYSLSDMQDAANALMILARSVA